MFILAFLLLLISYEVFFVGILGHLTAGILLPTVLGTVGIIIFWKRNDLRKFLTRIFQYSALTGLQKILISLLILQFLINLIGALGPETAFDALWYHLTLPKLYLLRGSIYHIPGTLLYYSDMPKLGEMLYTLSLSLNGATIAKLTHLLFGVLTTLSVYGLSRKYLPRTPALMAAVVFYASLVVAWESTTAYVDLIRAFYEVMALWAYLLWYETRRGRWFIISALLVGAAITAKLLALSSLAIFLILFITTGLRGHEKLLSVVRRVALYAATSLLVPLPWFIFAFIHTGNPIYPVFDPNFKIHSYFSFSIFNPVNFITDSWNLFLYSSDPINPLYIMLLPLIVLYYKKFDWQEKLITIYCLLGFLSWYLLPRLGGGRFILAYLPVFSLLAGIVIYRLRNNALLEKYLTLLVIVVAVSSIGYRGLANARYLPVLFGRESKQEFLTRHLNFSFGDFYDTDNYFKTHIKPGDKVLLYGFHNLYYIDFPFIDSSWVKKGDTFNYIAVQHAGLPARFTGWRMIYDNKLTGVMLYTKGEDRRYE